MSAREEKTGKPMSLPMMIIDSLTLIVGGTHTTGNTLHLLLGNLARHPQHLQHFVAELDDKLKPLEPGQACYAIDGLEEKLDFVNAAIKENHRQNAVGHFNMPRAVPAGGAEIAGFHVPGGVCEAARFSSAVPWLILMTTDPVFGEHSLIPSQPSHLGLRPRCL